MKMQDDVTQGEHSDVPDTFTMPSRKAIPLSVLRNNGKHRYLYVMGCYPGFVKVGVATDPHRRLEQIQANNPRRIELKVAEKVPFSVALLAEGRAHAALAKYHLHGEWFKTSVFRASMAVCAAIRETLDIAEELRERARNLNL